ncbi:hypothetical protein CRE_30586 [Caenorhabditis remanei]|uniref:Uncharacterized protein n=1 Tax=Caenorhabditis remanei TaxID=31234 RepID=E3NQY6_CAERE|nr:hypothetical protein CRE_30586 [Caenorhabditis remanei]
MEFFRSPPQTALFPVSGAFVTAALQQQQSSPSSNLPVIPSPHDIITTTSSSPIPITTSASPPSLPMFLSFPSTSTTTSILMDTVLAAQKLNQQQQQQQQQSPFNFLVVKQENPLPVMPASPPRNSPPHAIKVGFFFNFKVFEKCSKNFGGSWKFRNQMLMNRFYPKFVFFTSENNC